MSAIRRLESKHVIAGAVAAGCVALSRWPEAASSRPRSPPPGWSSGRWRWSGLPTGLVPRSEPPGRGGLRRPRARRARRADGALARLGERRRQRLRGRGQDARLPRPLRRSSCSPRSAARRAPGSPGWRSGSTAVGAIALLGALRALAGSATPTPTSPRTCPPSSAASPTRSDTGTASRRRWRRRSSCSAGSRPPRRRGACARRRSRRCRRSCWRSG